MTPQEKRDALERRHAHDAVCMCSHRFSEHEIDRVGARCSQYLAGAGEFTRCRCDGFTVRGAA